MTNDRMRYRRFGKTNLQFSVFSLGTMRCLASPAEAYRTVNHAIAQGINHLETARGYGKSEQYLGEIFRTGLAVSREQVYITTKLPPAPNADTMRNWLDESLQRLNLDYIDCLAIHGINTWEHLEWVLAPNGCMQPVQQAIASGKIRHLGFSTHGSLDVILAAISTDLFEFVNLHYYYFFQRHAAAIALAHQKDMGIFIISPADKGGRLYTPTATLKELCAPFSPLELNYRFLLSDRRITTLSVGAANPDELTEPLTVADKDYPLTPIEVEIIERLHTRMVDALSTDLCSQCYKCLPCPENINIPEVLRLRNLAVAYDMTDYGQYRYGMFGNAGHWFPGVKGANCTECGDCLPRCPQQLDIPKLLTDTHQRLNGTPRRRLWD
ncbi:NADP-dependent oxidoreductase domain protein [Crinalium epipsammum PCC 9333]|uniref:NADP-dependent oxidoreductase domain protein n=2 Tax=Crinalium TaxID=241421 RepID=K9VV34_9CYAN|nr:NADP-dependent oxidoreductase domain protein [Crinalium epipsammum PCC 9333]